MLTRSGVAKRLGKSIATVRRLEGSELHPTVDANGVHRFSENQVLRLLKRIHSGASPEAAQGEWLRGATSAVRRRPKQAPAEQASVAQQLTAARQEVALTILELLGPRRLRRLDSRVVDYLEDILGDH